MMREYSLLLCFGLVVVGGVELPAGRELDPVVVPGADLPALLGCVECVHNLVAFSWGKHGWTQVPVQVDERHYQDWYIIKNKDCRLAERNIKELVYADDKTLCGPDEDNALDEDDEIVFMARHLGDKFTGGDPPDGVLDAVDQEVEVTEPLDDDSTVGFIYLFLSDGSLDPGAGQNLVEYKFNLTATDSHGSNEYLDVYDFGTGGSVENKEDTTFRSKYYRRHFRENWNTDGLHIYAGDSTGEDMMAHQDFQFELDNCGRCVDSFTHSHTAFIANKVGPVRAIRSWVGANSGIVTQRDSVMYEQREDVTTHLRVHNIPRLMDYVVYKEGLPLTYYNCHNKACLQVDGDPSGDNFHKAFCPWDFVTGPAGTLFRAVQMKTDLGDWWGIPDSEVPAHVMDSWFYDDSEPLSVDEAGVAHYPGFLFCSGRLMEQKAAWGTHGIKTKEHGNSLRVPNTCPYRLAPHPPTPEGCPNVNNEDTLNKVEMTNSNYYLPPGLHVHQAEVLYNEATNPLSIRTK